jgi:hypothetical protein
MRTTSREEVVTYHRSSLQEREDAADRNRPRMKMEAVEGILELGEAHVYAAVMVLAAPMAPARNLRYVFPLDMSTQPRRIEGQHPTEWCQSIANEGRY